MAQSSGRHNAPSAHHVAARAGVSLATVSNVLNHPERVAEGTASKVRDAIVALGYSPNQNARALASGRTQSFGLVLSSLRNSLFTDIVSGANEAAQRLEHTLLIATTENDVRRQGDHLSFLEGARVSGVLLATMEESADQVASVRRHGLPLVYVNYKPSTVDACSVVVDNEQAGYVAGRHLIEQGCRRIAFVSARPDLQPVERRRAGLLRAVAERRGTTMIDVEAGDIDPPGGTDAGVRIAAMPDYSRPDGVLGVTDLLAMAVVTDLRAAGFSVPEDILVSGCDHNSIAWGGAVPLTTVTQRGEDMGKAAVCLLQEELADQDAHIHRTVVLSSELIPRESTLGRSHSTHEPSALPSDIRRTEA